MLAGYGDGGSYGILTDIIVDTARLAASLKGDPDHFARSFGATLNGGENLDNADGLHSITSEHAGPDGALLMPLFDALDCVTI